jgi:hypothetical protein
MHHGISQGKQNSAKNHLKIKYSYANGKCLQKFFVYIVTLTYLTKKKKSNKIVKFLKSIRKLKKQKKYRFWRQCENVNFV